MPRGRSTSRGRSASRSSTKTKKRTSSVPSKILGFSLKKIALFASDVLTAASTFAATHFAIQAKNRQAQLGYSALAISAGIVMALRVIAVLPAVVGKVASKPLSNFNDLWTFYGGFFGVPLIGYTTLAQMGVFSTVCTNPIAGKFCTGNGDMLDYLIALFTCFILSSAISPKSIDTAKLLRTLGYSLPILVVAAQAKQYNLAAAAFVYTFLTHFGAVIEKKIPFTGKFYLTDMASDFANGAIAYYSFAQKA